MTLVVLAQVAASVPSKVLPSAMAVAEEGADQRQAAGHSEPVSLPAVCWSHQYSVPY